MCCDIVCFVCDVVGVVVCVLLCVFCCGLCVRVNVCVGCKVSLCVLCVLYRVMMHGLISYLFVACVCDDAWIDFVVFFGGGLCLCVIACCC